MNAPDVLKVKTCTETSAKRTVIKYDWTIKQYVETCSNLRCIKSPIFPAESNCRTCSWCINFYPHGQNKKAEDNVSFFINVNSYYDNRYLSVHTTVKMNDHPKTWQFSTRFLSRTDGGFGWEKMINKDEIKKYLIEGDLKISCEIVIIHEILHRDKPVPVLKITDTTNVSTNNLQKLFQSDAYIDVKFEVEGIVFKGHKILLAACSDVFKKLFDENVNKDCIVINDTDSKSFEKMIKYIYFKELNINDAQVTNLLHAATKYKIESLKNECENYMAKSIKSSNAIDYLILADSEDWKNLKTLVIQYIKPNITSLMDTPKFKTMTNSHKHLLVDIFTESPLPPEGIKVESSTCGKKAEIIFLD